VDNPVPNGCIHFACFADCIPAQNCRIDPSGRWPAPAEEKSKANMIRLRLGSITRRTSRLCCAAQTLLACVPILIAATRFSAPAIVFGQDTRPHETKTEIWISGEDVALWRHVPRDRELVHPDDEDQFARSLLTVAQQRFDEGDEETAKWLVHWAQWLTDGRIGTVEFVELRPDVSEQSDSHIMPAVAERNIESTTSGETREAGALPATEAPSATSTPGNQDAEKHHDPDVVGQIPDTKYQVEAESPASPRDLTLETDASSKTASATPADIVGRQVALAAPDRLPTGGTDSFHDSAPVRPAEESLVVAVVGFAAGAVFCAALCTILCFAPFRLMVDRRTVSPSSVECETPVPTVQPAEIRDNNNWIVEEFYNQNVELYGQMAQKS